MLEMLDVAAEDVVAWRIDGKVTEEDMQRALQAMREVIARQGHVNVYQEILGFGGLDWDVIEEKMRFLREFGVGHFRKIAVVTDKKWLKKVIGWENRIFRQIDMRAFSSEERDRAMNFLAYDDAQAITN